MSTYGKNTPFMQLCHSSDRLSAVFGSNLDRDVSVPYLLDDNFDAGEAFRAVQLTTPTCLWVYVSENSPIDASSWLMSACADWQVNNDKSFVLAIKFS